MWLLNSLLCASLASSALGLAVPSDYVVHERRSAPPKRWVKRSEAGRDTILPMRIGLTQSNIENGMGAQLLHEVSHPKSDRYGKHYTAEEIIDIFAPAQDTVDTVRNWLIDAGIGAHRMSQSVNKQWIQFDAKVHEAEELFQTKYYSYENVNSGNRHVACDEYHLPSSLAEHVDYITPGLKLFGGSAVPSSRLDRRVIDLEERGFRTDAERNFSGPIFGAVVAEPADLLNSSQTGITQCDEYVTPICIKTMYNITNGTTATAGNQLGIFEEGDYYVGGDLQKFFETFATNIPPSTRPKLEGIDGGFAPGLYAGGESDLDFQISYPIIWPQTSILFQTDDFFYANGVESSEGFLNTFLDAIDGSYCTYSAYGETGDSSLDPTYPDPLLLGYEGQLQCGVYKPTNVISISYGEQEDDLPTNYQQRQCSEFMKLGMQGVSVVIASGDSGVAARSTDDGNSDGCLGNGTVFNPDFPANCPYLTAAGATFLPTGANVSQDAETAVTRFPSGGGFSNIYSRPSYQNEQVNTYLTAHTPPYQTYNTSGTNNPGENITQGGIYNVGGRGYPDVSAVGDNVVLYVNGELTTIGGTSAAAPVFASILTRINEERLAANKSTIGFVNPVLYSNPQAFHDITVGSNPGCNTDGFNVSEGWDPVTGLGTPNYPALLKVFMSLS